MADSGAELVQELKILRRGRGLSDLRVDHLGPFVRAACGVTDGDSVELIRQKIRHRMIELTGRLEDDDCRHATQAALGLSAEYPGNSLAERIELLARQWSRDVRTIRRRIDAGFNQLAEILSGYVDSPPSRLKPWHLGRFEAILSLESGSPECFERRTIIAGKDGLNEVSASITIPQVDPSSSENDQDLLARVYFGGSLKSVERPSPGRFLFRIGLPHVLQLGESHEFGLIVSLRRGQLMLPRYVFFPGMFCDEFDLRVRFGDRRPVEIFLVHDVYYRDLDSGSVTGSVMSADDAGEVHAKFWNLTPGYGYGLHWR